MEGRECHGSEPKLFRPIEGRGRREKRIQAWASTLQGRDSDPVERDGHECSCSPWQPAWVKKNESEAEVQKG